MNADEERVADLVRIAFAGVKLGPGIGLWEAQGIDDYADFRKLRAYRARDEKEDWSVITAADLDYCNSSPSFFDAAGMRFHLPAFLLADLAGETKTAYITFTLTNTRTLTERFELLSPEQRAAVREFLLLRLSDPHRSFDHKMISRALQDYWN